MSRLEVIMIDVGWGDSILLRAEDSHGNNSYGLIDSNDTKYNRSSRIFLQRYFEKAGLDIKKCKPIFDFVLLSHDHSDHGDGLKELMKQFGTKEFWYPKTNSPSILGHLLKYVERVGIHHESLDNSKPMPNFGDAIVRVLWPEPGNIIDKDNNNSVVLLYELDDSSFLLTGDAEEEVWDKIADDIPSNVKFIKVPHHGSRNGSLHNGNLTWLDTSRFSPDELRLGISSHIKPHPHPHKCVIDAFENERYYSGKQYFRTDTHYHLAFETEGNDVTVKYWH